MSRARLGEILVERNLVDSEQVEEALRFQSERGGRLGEILIGKKLLAETELYRALADQLGLPFEEGVSPELFDEELLIKVPINFAKRNQLIPLARNGRFLRVLTADPLNIHALDDVALLIDRTPVIPVVATPETVLNTINSFYDRATTLSGHEVESVKDDNDLAALDDLDEVADLLDATDEDAPIIRYVNQLLFQAVKDRASDIHIEPQEKELLVRLRVDGIMYVRGHPQKRFQSAIISRVKVMANLDIAEKRLPQDGRIRIKIAGRDIDIRVSTVPTPFGEKVVMRLLDKTNILLSLEDIGFSTDKLEQMNRLIKRTNGIILVTGPTGSGKTTTLYACLNKINNPEVNITTVEDPIEYQLKGITQIGVNEKIDLSFASGLRSILRQDPDIIMVGEIRDTATAEMAIQASLTGHLVFSTLHTNDAAGAVARLRDMRIEPFLISSTLSGVLAQRLVRTICPDCREPHEPTDEQLRELSLKREELPDGQAWRGRGCTACGNLGYRGRTGIYELMVISEKLQSMILDGADSNQLKRQAMKESMLTLRQDGGMKVRKGITTIEEVMRVTQEELFEAVVAS